MKPKITIYGGIGEIGGNKFLIEDKDARIFLDFGASFSRSSEYFSGFLQPRNVNGIGDYVEFGLLPKLPGLYADSYAQTANIHPRQPEFDAVFVSHPHIDHVGYVNFLHPDIPVYMGETCKIILDSVRATGGYNAGEGRFVTFRTGASIHFGSLTIQPIHVDHSIPGSYGFIIETSGGVIVYTGDLRLHGPMKKMTTEFLEKARRAEPIAILTEGTRIVNDSARFTEADVYRLSSKIVSKSKSLVISAFYGRDIDRINSFFRVARETGRTFVVPPKTAHLLTCLEKDKKLKTPRLTHDSDILVYKKRKRTGTYEPKDYWSWERPFIERAVSFDYIQKNQSKVLLSLDLASFTELVDIRPSSGDFIHSMSEPFSEEDVEKDKMKKWLKHFSLKHHQIHASGHATRKELIDMVRKISPQRIFPIHTERPDEFRRIFQRSSDVTVPKLGIGYEL